MLTQGLTLEKEELSLAGQRLYIYRPARLEEVFQGDPFAESHRFPFWVKVWPASLVLAQFLVRLAEKEGTKAIDGSTKRVLEIGAGLGVPSLFAAASGFNVLATDKEELPLKLLEKAATEQGITLKTLVLDWLHLTLKHRFDLIIGAEVVIKSSLFDPILKLFDSYLAPGGYVVLTHEEDRKRTLVPFLVKAQEHFNVETGLWSLREEDKVLKVVLNRLIPKKS